MKWIPIFKEYVDRQVNEYQRQMRINELQSDSSTRTASSESCDSIQRIVSEAEYGFRRVAGRRDPDGGGEAFYSTVSLPGSEECEVWLYRDRDLGKSLACDFPVAPTSSMLLPEFDRLTAHFKACLPSWSSRSNSSHSNTVKDLTFSSSGKTSVSIRLMQKRSSRNPGYLISIWFDRE